MGKKKIITNPINTLPTKESTIPIGPKAEPIVAIKFSKLLTNPPVRFSVKFKKENEIHAHGMRHSIPKQHEPHKRFAPIFQQLLIKV
jgi:hypothetical protein